MIVVGQSSDGNPFRPSDWAERLVGSLSVYSTEKLAHVRYTNTYKCLVVNQELEQINYDGYKFLMDFIRLHQLNISIS